MKKKYVWSFLLVFLLIMMFMPISAYASDVTIYLDGANGNDTSNGTESAPLKTFSNAISKITDSTSTTIKLLSNITDGACAIGTTDVRNKTTPTKVITLDLNGFSWNSQTSQTLITLWGDVDFTIDDSSNDKEGKVIVANGRVIENLGVFRLKNGTLTGDLTSTNYWPGAGICNDAGSYFEMTGGKITKCKVKDDSANGGAVSVGANSEFKMTGGEITQNTAGNGAGIYVASTGKVTIAGGRISDNVASKNGGGVYVENGATFTAEYSHITGNKADCGGAIYNVGYSDISMVLFEDNETTNDGGVFYIKSNGQTEPSMCSRVAARFNWIWKNKAKKGSVCFVENGATGVFSTDVSNPTAMYNESECGTFYTNGALGLNSMTVSNNKATENGAGVYVDTNGTLFVGSKIIINDNTTNGEQNNIYLKDGRSITFGSGVDVNTVAAGTKLGVTTENLPDGSTPIQITSNGLSEYNSYLISDKEDMLITFANDHFNLGVYVAPVISSPRKYKAKDSKDTAEKISGSGKKGSTRTITPVEGKKVGSVTVTDKNGNPVEVVKNEDGTYSFKQPASDVNVEVTYVNREIKLTIGSTEASVDDEEHQLDVTPVIRNDRTMLPIRFVAENLGAKVEWDEKNPEYVVITKGDIKIEITLGSDKAKVNGKEFTLDSVAFAENDRTYLPVRFVSEQLNAIVEWNEARPMEVLIYER